MIQCSCIAANYLQQAATLFRQKRPEQALQLLYKGEQENPDDWNTLFQLATVNYYVQNYQASTKYYEKLLKANPRHINIRYNCAAAYCKLGQFDNALSYYESVYQSFQDDSIRSALFKLYIRNQQWNKAAEFITSRLWWYDENIYGKKIVLDIDKPGNGFGDGIQFIRYAQILAQAGAQVIVRSSSPLVPLLSLAPYISQIITKHDPLPSHDELYDICIVSLLISTKNKQPVPPQKSAYLWADSNLIAHWKKQCAPEGINVGLCWQSSFIRDRFTGKVIPSPRSVPLEQLAPLAAEGIHFHSLQKINESIDAPFSLTQFGSDFDEKNGRFMDTAAVIMNMDIIITVDTSIAHLAAALGKPVWILLSCESDYRWFRDTDRSSFYPTARLFRQTTYGEWSSVIAQVKEALHQYQADQK